MFQRVVLRHLQRLAVRLVHALCGGMDAYLEDPHRKIAEAVECSMPKSEAAQGNITATSCRKGRLLVQQMPGYSWISLQDVAVR